VSLQHELLGIERLLWKNNPDLYRENYADDALITFAETGVIDLSLAVEAIRRENAEGTLTAASETATGRKFVTWSSWTSWSSQVERTCHEAMAPPYASRTPCRRRLG